MNAPRTIGLIAGGRQFPVLVAKGARKAGHKVVAAGFHGHTDHETDLIAETDVFEMLKLGKLAQLFKYFKKNGVQDVVMAGTINKPKIMDVRHFDLKAVRLIFSQPSKGDSVLLGALTRAFEKEGMQVLPPHQFLPELLTPEGVLTKRVPTPREWEDLRYGYEVGKVLGTLDVGQCLVLREKIIAAVEAIEGTDECIRRGLEFGGEGGVVIKVFKPGQEERVDLPSAGVDTIRVIAEGKGAVLGLEAGKSLLFDEEAAVRAADEAGIALVGFTAEMLQTADEAD